MTVQISFKRNDCVFHTGPRFGHLCRGRRIHMSGRSNLGIFNNLGASSIFGLSISRYCASYLSCASWQSGFNIHNLCCRHLWCWWSLFSEYCIRSRIIFHNVASEYNSTFVFLVLCLQFGILQMTCVHQWGKMNFCARRPCFIDHLFFYFWLSSGPTTKFSPFFTHSLSTAAFAAGIFIAWGIRMNLCTKLYCCSEVSPFLQYGLHDISVEILPYAFLWIHWLPRYMQI